MGAVIHGPWGEARDVFLHPLAPGVDTGAQLLVGIVEGDKEAVAGDGGDDEVAERPKDGEEVIDCRDLLRQHRQPF